MTTETAATKAAPTPTTRKDLTMDFKTGDRVRVTRRPKEGGTHTWEGVLKTVSPTGGFTLDGVDLATGRPEVSYFADAATLLRSYGCVQTVEILDH